MSRRVLVVASSFPPQGGTGTLRIAKFVKYLPEYGWQPVVVCADMAWNPDPTLAADVPPDVKVHRVPWPRPVRPFAPRPRAARRGSAVYEPAGAARAELHGRARGLALAAMRNLLVPDVGVLWVRGAQHACASVLRETPCDVVLTTSPPNSTHLAGEWVKARFGLPWVADFRDVWTAENLGLQTAGRIHFARQRRTEARILAACDRAIMITDGLAARTLEVFGQHLGQKMLTITNGYDPADFQEAAATPAAGAFTVVYAGSVLGPQVANDFPDGLRLALQNDAFRRTARVLFVGQLDPGYRNRLAGLEGTLEFRDVVPHGEAVQIMRSANVLLLVLPDTRLARLTHTNKFFEYLAAGRPIMALAPEGEISRILAEGKAGVAVPPNDPTAIAHTLLEMFDASRSGTGSYEPNAALMARFDRRNLTRELANFLNEAVEKHHDS